MQFSPAANLIRTMVVASALAMAVTFPLGGVQAQQTTFSMKIAGLRGEH